MLIVACGAPEPSSATDETDSAAGETGGSMGDGDGDGDIDIAACGYGEGPNALTYSIEVEDPLLHLRTDEARPATAEIYCYPASLGGSRSIVLVPGLGLSHYLFMGTPDGRAGWATLFAEAGITAHVLNPARNLVNADHADPDVGWSIWAVEDFWDRWGMGPAYPDPYEDTRFPVGDMGHFLQHLPYYGPGPGGTGVSQEAVDELVETLEQVGPSVLLVHSAAGPAGFQVALDRPDLVRAMVVIEPTGCPEIAGDVPKMPFMAVYGDYVQARGQSGRFASCMTTAELAAAAGFAASFLDYPGNGVNGNGHLLMQDDNNADIANDIIAWLDAEVF